ncbi:HAD-IIIC family phosphatase [Rhodoferax sp.]|uniref:HAD-IIIC family phosphatase n=1 Tax=Rhodoferax sp. TaxID=50421 RepID=UPI00374D91D9
MTESCKAIVPKRTADADGELRNSIAQSVKAGAISSALQGAHALLQNNPSLVNFRFLRQLVKELPPELNTCRPYRVALLSSFSIDFIQDSLVAYGFSNGLRIEVYQSGFSLINQEILDPTSGLYAFAPDVTILAIEGEDWLPEVYTDFMDADQASASLDLVVDNFKQKIGTLLRTLRDASTMPLLVHNLAQPRLRRAGIADVGLTRGQAKLVIDLNRALVETTADIVDVHIVDYAGLVNQFGAQHWYDARMRLYARAPIAMGMLGNLAQEYMKFFRALKGLSKKCLVVDLDNTLWGGVIGEDGIDGIQLGPTYPGSAFVEFQRAILDLYRRGVLLAVASKNNPADVDAVFANHRFMTIRKEHFAELQIHWNPKSDSLKIIATRLNIGLDHMVFVDDNPAECEQVRRELPMVTVIELPCRPELYVEALCAQGLFDTLGLSDEDRRRGQLYQQRAMAETARSSSSNLEDYYRDLDMTLSVAPVDSTSRARAAQLTQKTNQFNATTVRLCEAELDDRVHDPSSLAVTVGVRDRFGDNGIVGLMMARADANRLTIDNFLLSCRVIGRTVETAMLAYLCDAARQRGLNKLCGRVVPTDKNVPVRDLFEKHGFCKLGEDDSGSTTWELDLAKAMVRRPDWFQISVPPQTSKRAAQVLSSEPLHV